MYITKCQKYGHTWEFNLVKLTKGGGPLGGKFREKKRAYSFAPQISALPTTETHVSPIFLKKYSYFFFVFAARKFWYKYVDYKMLKIRTYIGLRNLVKLTNGREGTLLKIRNARSFDLQYWGSNSRSESLKLWHFLTDFRVWWLKITEIEYKWVSHYC